MNRPPRKRRAPHRDPISVAIPTSQIDPFILNIDLPPQSLPPGSPEWPDEAIDPFNEPATSLYPPLNSDIEADDTPFDTIELLAPLEPLEPQEPVELVALTN
jgi:hypothetical protein